MRSTVIVITLQRPDYLRRCLECLQAQTRLPDQVIVVDSSRDDLSREVAADFPSVEYVRNETGFGRMTASRNLALGYATGDVIAFLDDDSFAHPTWLEKLLETYQSPDVKIVGGRALNAMPNEATIGVNEIGRITRSGVVTGNFAADPGRVIEVDHIIGCNMSFHREVLARLGGFRTDFPGHQGLREDTDMCLRAAGLGYKLLFNPAAVVDHVGAPLARGRRFDVKYVFYTVQNTCLMLQRNYGAGNSRFWRYLVEISGETLYDAVRRVGGAVLRLGAVVGGAFCGFGQGFIAAFTGQTDPVRRDPEAEALRRHLSSGSVWSASAATYTAEGEKEGRRSRVRVVAKRFFPDLFFRLKRWKNARYFREAHGGAEYRAKKALVQHYGLKVLAGPFAGMRYGDDVQCGAYVAKLVGSYEEELHGVIQQIIARRYRRVVDVGCAEGYYAVGLALKLPEAQVLAYDINDDARRFCADLAKRNGVADRVELRGSCDHAELSRLCDQHTLVVCDCEGFEFDLLDPAKVPGLATTDMLVELHEYTRPGLTSELLRRFAATHRAVLVDTQDRDSTRYPMLEVVEPADRPWAVREGRGVAMQWVYFTALIAQAEAA